MMKSRLLLIAILAVGLTALYCGLARPHVSTIPNHIREPLADLKLPELPPLEPPALVIPPLPAITPPPLRPITRDDPILGRPEVPIQHGATIDFSTGFPIVKAYGKDQEAIERAVPEMAAAAEGVTFEAKK